MSPEQHSPERPHLQHEAEHSRPKKKVSVVGYLAILFAASFLLLLLSYFMQHRSSEETINDLTNSMNNLQSLGNLVDQNKALLEKNQTLQDQLTEAQNALKDAQSELKEQEETQAEAKRQLASMDWLWRIQRAYSRGNKTEAKTLVQSFEASGLPSSLPQAPLAQSEGPSPAEQYTALLTAIGIQRTEP